MKLEQLIEKLQEINKLFPGELFIESYGFISGSDSQIKIQEVGTFNWNKIIYKDVNPHKEMVTINES